MSVQLIGPGIPIYTPDSSPTYGGPDDEPRSPPPLPADYMTAAGWVGLFVVGFAALVAALIWLFTLRA